MNQKQLKKGTYQHYKGGEYQVIDTVIHSETEELMVLYRPMYGEQKLWVRPFSMFFEQIDFAGKKVERFKFISGSDER
ncbi:MAG: DUF1653 domain-containing protein [Kangiellaceae bacterium]|nr:DUF1653 domain-containing protein [Kangiellaceae bacterium]